MTVLLVGRHYGHEYDLLREEITQRGSTAEIIDTTDWPSSRPVTLKVADRRVQIDEKTLDFDDVTGVFFRQNALFVPAIEDYLNGCVSEDENPYSVITQLREYRGLFRSILSTLEYHGTSVAPGIGALEWQELNLHTAELFDSLELPVPDTLATVDAKEAKRFLKEHETVVYKPVAEYGRADTMTVEESEQLEDLVTPVVFQELVPGDDVRAYVVDGEFVGAFKYVVEDTTFSYKHANDSPSAERIELSDRVKEDVLKAVEVSPLRFSAVDLRVDEEGAHTLLEVNAGGRFMLPDSSGVTNVTETLADFLLQ